MFEFINNFRKTVLQLAIRRGMQPDGDLADEISKLSDYKIARRRDVEIICEALEAIPDARKTSEKFTSDLRALAGLFQQVEDFDSTGFECLRYEGIPELVRIAQSSLEREDIDEDDLLFVLRILALYGSEDGARLIVEAARKPVRPESWWWTTVFGAMGDGHPHREFIFGELSVPLPEQFIAMAMLDAANRLSMENALENHPFNSERGAARLRQWLTGTDPEQFSYATSATAALPFLDLPWRTELSSLADHHQDPYVRLEAAWARARSGDTTGIEQLADMCLDINLSERAKHYLGELERTNAIPMASSEPDFCAQADFANWLAHPNELGHPPDELEIVDKRELCWPPEGERKMFWLIRYTDRDKSELRDDSVGCGVVGSMTFCFFTNKFEQRPPEDCYSIHCYWEMKGQNLIEVMEVTNPAEYASMLSQWKGDAIDSARIISVAELSSELKYPQKLVALAEARRGGQEGWLVLDGPRSTWYPQTDFPESGKYRVLDLHVGHRLLGFTATIDRKRFLAPPQSKRDPRQVVETYELLFMEAESGDQPRRKKLLGDWKSPILKHFERYVDSKSVVGGNGRAEALVAAYERYLRAVRNLDDESKKKALDEMRSPLKEHFIAYVDALVAANRPHEIETLLGFFDPVWEHGSRLLGTAAYKIRKYDLAEQYFLNLKDGLDDYCRSEEMSLLAEIWVKKGKTSDAQELLVDCLKRLQVMIDESKYSSDQQMHESEFQHHRGTFLRLFPSLGQAELSKHGVRESALP